ncbi:MAG: formylglycine-generating enzyme family protein [Candidatus Hydrogenedentes bacterium]|nr:formylglycine-generating enzyme family protein [Candidatus Hydrogenedentota bacterium]
MGILCFSIILFFLFAITVIVAVSGYSGCSKEPAEGEGEPGDETTIMLPGNVPLVLLVIPAGSFMMGRYAGDQDSYDWEDPQHQVTLSQDFSLCKYELTKGQWQAVMGTTPWSGHSYVLDDLDSPAVYVSWNDAQSFITALNAHITRTGQGSATFRLPSEAEWEYACRAGTTTRFYWGDDPGYTPIDDYAWWYDNALDVNEYYAHVVGLKLPNAFGLYDMSGNVWEWCEDWYGAYSSGSVSNPEGPGRGSYRVFRGGSWYGYGYYCRSARRNGTYPTYTSNSFGFRLAR